MQKVEVYVSISGDYCAFHETSLSVVYDITNNISLNDMELEDLENWDPDDHENKDVEKRDAYLIDGVYYVKW